MSPRRRGRCVAWINAITPLIADASHALVRWAPRLPQMWPITAHDITALGFSTYVWIIVDLIILADQVKVASAWVACVFVLALLDRTELEDGSEDLFP